MPIKKLFFTNVEYQWHDSSIKLLTNKNVNDITNSLSSQDYFTSYQDIGIDLLSTVFAACEILNVEYLNINATGDSWIQGRIVNEIFQNRHKLDKEFDFTIFNLENVTTLRGKKKLINAPTLWTAGCSVTAGFGVSFNQSWPILLSNQLNLPLVNLSCVGGSNLRSVDQLLRSDIQENDIVILGVTSLARISSSSEADPWQEKVFTVLDWERAPKNLQWCDITYFYSHDLHRRNITSILQLINFCKKIKSKLIIANLLDATWFNIFFRDQSCYLNLANTCFGKGNADVKFIDLGYDNMHPGPLQHQEYANKIFEKIKCL